MKKSILFSMIGLFFLFLLSGCAGTVETGPVPTITQRPPQKITPLPTAGPEITKVPDGPTPIIRNFKEQYEQNETLPSLSDLYHDFFTIGIEVVSEDIEDEKRQELVTGQFNSLSCREDFAPEKILVYEEMNQLADKEAVILDLTAVEPFLQFALENEFPFVSSALITDTMPSWFFTKNYSEEEVKKTTGADGTETEEVTFADASVMEKRIENYLKELITQINTKYPGIVVVWEVVEDAVYKEDLMPEYYKNNYWYQILGEKYISLAFSYARKYAEEKQKLFYCDDQLEDILCIKTITKILGQLTEEGTVDGISIIGNFTYQAPNMLTLDDMFKAVSTYGLEIRLKDFFVNSRTNSEDDKTKTVDEIKARNPKRYKSLFTWFENSKKQEKYNIVGITFEGLTDNTSPLNEPAEYVDKTTGETVIGVEVPTFPYLFDENLSPKDEYFAALRDESIKSY